MKLWLLTGIFLLLFANSLFAQNPDSFAKSPSTGFIENKGQIIDQNKTPNPSVLFLLNTPGFNVQLRRGGFSYDLYECTELSAQGTGSKDEGRGTKNRIMEIRHPASEIWHPASGIRHPASVSTASTST